MVIFEKISYKRIKKITINNDTIAHTNVRVRAHPAWDQAIDHGLLSVVKSIKNLLWA